MGANSTKRNIRKYKPYLYKEPTKELSKKFAKLLLENSATNPKENNQEKLTIDYKFIYTDDSD